MKTPIFTKNLGMTFTVALIGFCLASGPMAWTAMRYDVSGSNPSGDKEIAIILGLLKFQYSTLSLIVKEALLCGVGLGVAALINWVESRISTEKLGTVAGGFAMFAVVGAVISIGIYIGILDAGVNPSEYNENYVKYLRISFIVYVVTIVAYFGTLLQIRRVIDVRN